MKKKREFYSPEFKVKVALAAIKEKENVFELAARFGPHPTTIRSWKRRLMDDAIEIFDKNQKLKKSDNAKIDELNMQIEKLRTVNEFLSEKLNL